MVHGMDLTHAFLGRRRPKNREAADPRPKFAVDKSYATSDVQHTKSLWAQPFGKHRQNQTSLPTSEPFDGNACGIIDCGLIAVGMLIKVHKSHLRSKHGRHSVIVV